jgi:HEAT repeat protein
LRGSQPLGFRTSAVSFLLVVAFGPLALLHAVADGCFVFKWNKAIDINEPTQKAIIVHDAGREDLLLQVKYEGPLEEFGWLIPVPSLPKVEKGSMEAFYELSQLTQRQFGRHSGVRTLGMAARGGEEEAVKVVEVKTVGAYEVAVLSAQDAGSLARWLQAHDYSLPDGKSEIVEEYIRRGWYFVAAKIQLDKVVSFKAAAGARPKAPETPSKAGKVVKSQLANGELHPLIISFDTPQCVFPLKISAVGGKPSEVSLYVLSQEPLLNRFIFDKGRDKLNKRLAEWEQSRPQRDKARATSMQNLRSLQLASRMYSLNPAGGAVERKGRSRDWTLQDIVAIGKEGQPAEPPEILNDDFYASSFDLLLCLQVTPDNISQSSKALPRLKNRCWYLTKQDRTFRPEEMQDLEFEPAIQVLAKCLPLPEGKVAAGVMARCGSAALPILVSACGSSNSIQRINAASGLQSLKDPSLVDTLLALLHDDLPQVRFHAVTAVIANWTPRFIDPLITLFRDPQPQIRSQAVNWLALKETADRAPIYVNLLKDPNLDVQACALRVLARFNRVAIPRTDLLRLLGSSRVDVVSLALNTLQDNRSMDPVQPWNPEALPGKAGEKKRLPSAEAAILLTNQLTLARLMGLRVLQQNGDAKAVELTLPLIKDTNSIVRSRAFAVLQTVSGQNVSEKDPAKWEAWWAANKDSFTPRRPAQ